MFGKRAFDEGNRCASAVQKRCRADTDGQDEVGVPPPKTAIELAMEEAEEYERRKEAEQRRLQQLKLESLDKEKTRWYL